MYRLLYLSIVLNFCVSCASSTLLAASSPRHECRHACLRYMPADITRSYTAGVFSGEPGSSSCPVRNLPSTSKQLEGPVVPTQCEPHKNNPDWYCLTCDLPGCAECMLQDHGRHETVEVTDMAKKLEPDLLALSKVADKWLTTLQNIASDLETADTQMETEEAEAYTEITKTADAMRAAITECEKKLLNKVKEATEAFKKQATKAKKECDVLKNTASSLNMSVERLKAAKSPLRTVLHAPIAKQKILQQQDVAVPSVQWKMKRTSVKPGETLARNVVGDVEMKTSVEQEKTFQTENVILQPSLEITDLHYKGKWAVAGIAPIYDNMVCVAHCDEFLWVYTDDGDLRQKVSIPEIEEICGVVAVDGKRGKLAVVDDGKRKVHFVKLSVDLEVQRHTTKDVPLEADCISLSGQKQLIVGHSREKMFAVLAADGDEPPRTVQADNIPDGEIFLTSIVQTKAGYVICDRDNKKVYFTDGGGHVVHVSTDCEWPWCAAVTSWGHVLIADYDGDEIKAFSEVGDYLGRLRDNSSQIICPTYIYIDEAEGLLYVACEPEDAVELRKYRFTVGDLPLLPITRSVTKMTMTLNLADVYRPLSLTDIVCIC